MGLKSGSRDAGFDETEEKNEQSAEHESTAVDAADVDTESPEPAAADMDSEPTSTTSTQSDTERTTQRPAMNSIPYKLRREKVNEGRE